MKLIYFINLNWKFFKRQCVTFQKKSKNYSEAKKGRGAYTLCFLLSISMYLWGCKRKIWIKWNSSKATDGCHALTHCTILTRFPPLCMVAKDLQMYKFYLGTLGNAFLKRRYGVLTLKLSGKLLFFWMPANFSSLDSDPPQLPAHLAS